ncbi:hypothetical protein niasHT_039123 [Heterodera trifolii]|uniref:IST1 homolog n=1 Tax=Heterodera trifolii TaxID=157864 RepID=A0ABD2HZ96_9BILA
MSVSWGTQYSKLKTNLRLAANRLRLLQKKKTEQAVKARCEIADFLSTDKEDRARIRVETIIREDFVVEAYELLEMYCELLLARFGIIQQMKELDDGIAEAVSSLLWVAPRIGHEIAEFKVINDELTHKYGKQFAEAARMNQLPEPSRVSPKLVQKLSVSAPSKLLVEKYLVTIAQSAGVDFAPDAKVMREDDDEIARAERNLINFMNEEQYGWTVRHNDDPNSKGGGGGHFAAAVGGPADPLMNQGSNNNSGGGANAMPMPPNGSGAFAMSPSAFVPSHPSPLATSSSPPPEYAPPPPPPAHGAGVYRQQTTGGHTFPTGDLGNKSGVGAVYPSAHPPPAGTPTQPFPNATPPPQQHYQQQQQQHLEHFGAPSEHIYQMPQERDDDFLLPKLPDPPSHLPANSAHFIPHTGGGRTGGTPHNTSGAGGGGGGTDEDTAANKDLDFDALAKRFEELKKRL